jgi:hypothetical protein
METLIKILVVLSWIAVIACPLIIVLKVYLQSKYEGSLEQTVDMMKGAKATYTNGILKLLGVFIIALIYLIVR